MLYKLLLTFRQWIKPRRDHSMVLFMVQYKVVLTFESVEESLKCDHSNESYRAVLSCGAVYYAVQDDSNFGVFG